MRDVVELLGKLVSISSVSGESNRGVIEFAQGILSGSGWRFEEHAYCDVLGTEKINLIAWPADIAPPDRNFHMVLVCHTDTVPYADSWTDATTLVADNGILKGCGACDVKGFLACILSAVSELDQARLKKPLGVVFTADEEVGCVGVRHLVEERVFHAKFAIVGEPTSLRPVSSGKGYCLAEVTVSGREAHSAFPENGESAIYRAAKLIVEIEKIAERLEDLPVDGFSPPWTTINVGEISGGLAKNIVPPSCRFLLEWRPVAGQDPDLVVGLVGEAIAALTAADPSFHCELKVLRKQEGFSVDGNSPLLSAIIRAGGGVADSVAFGTEAPWLNKLGAQAVVFGPGSMQSAHSPRECVPRNELYRCVEIIRAVIYDLCG